MLVGFDLDTEPFAASAVDVHGLQFAALDLVQHGLSGDAECRGGLVEAEPALWCLVLGSDHGGLGRCGCARVRRG